MIRSLHRRLDDPSTFILAVTGSFLGCTARYPLDAIMLCLVFFVVVTRAWVAGNPEEEVESS